jgi:hypothetical protein
MPAMGTTSLLSSFVDSPNMKRHPFDSLLLAATSSNGPKKTLNPRSHEKRQMQQEANDARADYHSVTASPASPEPQGFCENPKQHLGCLATAKIPNPQSWHQRPFLTRVLLACLCQEHMPLECGFYVWLPHKDQMSSTISDTHFACLFRTESNGAHPIGFIDSSPIP